MPKKELSHAREYAEFKTVTCLEWKSLLSPSAHKDIVVNSLKFLSETNRASIYAFVIMDNHFHLIWQILMNHTRENVQRDFLKFTAQQILKLLRNANSPVLDELVVGAPDRRRQIWERNSLGIPLWSTKVFEQKIRYIHDNPVNAGLCKRAEDYKYSSAGFYYRQDRRWTFLEHYDG